MSADRFSSCNRTLHRLWRRDRVLTFLGCACLIALHYALGLTATLNKCTAFDEILHITSGYSYNRYGDFRLQPENGILPQRWVALPWLWHDLPFLPSDHFTWRDADTASVAHLFFYELGNDADRMLFAGRAMNGLWGIALGSILFVWTIRIAGKAAAWLTLVLWATSPMFLAHDFVATSDSMAAFLFLASVGGLWSTLHRLTWGRLIVSCSAIAALFLSKFSAPIIVPMGLFMGVVRLAGRQPWPIDLLGMQVLASRWKMFLAMIALACVYAASTWCVIWISYGVRYSAAHSPVNGESPLRQDWEKLLANPDTVSRIVESARDRQFLPEAYLHGFLFTHRFAQSRSAFLLGEYRTTGWRIFFPFCELVKTPTGTLILLIAAAAAIGTRCLGEKSSQRFALVLRGFYLTAPLWSLFIVYWFFAISSKLNIGHRHVLPAEGPMLMFAGAAAWWFQTTQPPAKNDKSKRASEPFALRMKHHPAFAVLTIGCVIANVSVALWTWPNYLAFFNLPSGGPKHGWKKLVDSSLDWGQELPSLRAWLDSEIKKSPTNTPFYFSYFGTGEPNYYRVRATLLPCFFDRRPHSAIVPLQPGVYCISASNVHGLYIDYPGPWTDEFEKLYQSSRKLETLTNDQSFRRSWATLTESEQLRLHSVFRQYEHLRFTRLTHVLRCREPDAHINYSILIYRVDAKELAKALDGPPDAWKRMTSWVSGSAR